jgi:hypothetical protein
MISISSGETQSGMQPIGSTLLCIVTKYERGNHALNACSALIRDLEIL